MDTPNSFRFIAPTSAAVIAALAAFLVTDGRSLAADAAPAAATPPAPRGGGGQPPLTFTPSVAAPVPALVAIPRPTDAEVRAAADNLKRVLQADPATRAFVAKYPGVIDVRPPRAINPAVVPSLSAQYRMKHEANLAVAKQGASEVLFIGDSITDFWRTTGKAVFDQYYGSMKVANFGISGDTTQGVLYRLLDGEGQGFQPKTIMLMIGTNNGAAASSAEIAEGVGAIVMEMRKDFPAAKILLLGIFPRADPGSAIRKTVLDVNPIIAKLHDGKNVFYLDIGDKFLDPAGNITPDIMPDKLHPTEKGYGIWAEAVKDKLAELMK